MTKYYSQVDQDKFLNQKVFKNMKEGFFVDIGAFDGVTISNTYFFEKYLNWDGICFEPMPHFFKLLKKNRSADCYNVCVGDEQKTVSFKIFEDNPMFSGISSHIETNQVSNTKKFRIIKSKMIDINGFFLKKNIKEIHYLSLDVEGYELKILHSLNTDNVFIHTISIEDNYNTKEVDKTLIKKNFLLIKFNGFDKIFINKNSKYFHNMLYLFHFKASILSFLANKYLKTILKKLRLEKITLKIFKLLN